MPNGMINLRRLMKDGPSWLPLDGAQYGVKQKFVQNATITRWRGIWCIVKVYLKFEMPILHWSNWNMQKSHFWKLILGLESIPAVSDLYVDSEKAGPTGGNLVQGKRKKALRKLRTVGHRLVLVITYTVNFCTFAPSWFLNLCRSSFQYCFCDIRPLYRVTALNVMD